MKPNYDKELKIFRPVLSAADKIHLEHVRELVDSLAAIRPSSEMLQNAAEGAQAGLLALDVALAHKTDAS